MTRVALVVVLALAGCATSADTVAPATREPVGEAWPAADALFHQEPRWLGADNAYSVPLGNDRTLWLFGDTFVSTSDAHRRDESVMVSNTIAIQEGLDPTSARMRFVWREPARSVPRAELLPRELGLAPGAFLPDEGEARHWPAHGARVGDALVLFWMRVLPSSEGLGFRLDGTRAVLVENADDDPLAWRMRDLAYDAPAGMLVGTMGVVVHEGHLVALSSDEPDHRAYLARWPLDRVAAGELGATEWWSEGAWSATPTPRPVFDDGAPEGSLHMDGTLGAWVIVQSTGFGATPLDVRTSPSLQATWGPKRTFFQPPEGAREGVFVYAGKAHPELVSDGLAVTYAQNAEDFGTLVSDDSIYWPRFVLLRWN